MKVTTPFAGVMIVLALLTTPTAAQQKAPEKKPVPAFSDDDVPSGLRSTGMNGATDSWSRANAAWPQLKSVRARMVLDSPDGRVEGLFEAVQPNRFRMAIAGIDMIIIGQTMYMKTPGSGWERQATNSSSAFSFKGLLTDEFLKGGEPKLVGSEKLDGFDTDVYEVTSVDGLGGPARVWIGKSDGLPRKLKASVGAMPVMVTFYDFNKDDISIQAPM